MTKTSFTFKTLTVLQVQLLARSHIKRFETLLELGGERIRRAECGHYLVLWKNVLAKASLAQDSSWKARCTEEERQEIEDACTSGDYDDLLTNLVDKEGAA